MSLPAPGLTSHQRELLDEWLPGLVVDKDHSWGIANWCVLEVRQADRRFIVKATPIADHHFDRELHAHQHWLRPWTDTGHAPALVHFDTSARILVTRWLPGRLVLDTPYADDPDVYEQAGRLLARLHAQPAVESAEFESRENQLCFERLDGPHRIAPEVVRRLRDEVGCWPTPSVTLVPTHGDWQTRNWLIDDGVVRVIDFGRAALRPPMADLTQLSAEDFRRRPDLAEAFFRGYGPDPRSGEAWHRFRVREAVGTATFAYRICNETFEAQGHRMIDEALVRRDPDS